MSDAAQPKRVRAPQLQPMATAPKDGSVFAIVLEDLSGFFSAYWGVAAEDPQREGWVVDGGFEEPDSPVYGGWFPIPNEVSAKIEENEHMAAWQEDFETFVKAAVGRHVVETGQRPDLAPLLGANPFGQRH